MLRPFLSRAVLVLAAPITALAAPTPPPSASPFAPAAEFFDLNQVRLGPGPFLTAQETDETYLLKLEPDRFLAWFRKEAGLAPKAKVYGGWESQGVAGHDGGHYLSALAQMYGATGNPEFKRRADYMVGELALCQQANGNGYVAAIPNGKTIFAQIKAGQINTPGNLNGGWVPWYTIHKEFAGLLDVYHYCHNDQALDIAEKFADWVGDEIGGLTHEQMQHMLEIEHGGMTEALANLYADTGDAKYLALAEKFRHDKVFLPLAQDRDILTGLHANTQIPKFIGYERVYELTGDPEWHAAAGNFWKTVTENRAWVIGGNSEDEHFFAPTAFEAQMNDTVGPESCNSYNMLKLTEHLFQAQPSGPLMDYYERTLYNHILSTIRPHQDGFVYYTSMSPGSFRTYSTDFNDFWCCVGTGMENHAKYGKAIYAHEGNGKLLVNLFIASTLDWPAAGVTVTQKTSFPEEPRTTLVFHGVASKPLEVDVRYPSWVAPGALRLTINGKPQAVTAQPGSYVPTTRTWKDGDTLRVDLPMTLRTEMLPHSADYVAVLDGPLVLAGKLGLEGLTDKDFSGQRMDGRKRLPQPPVIARPIDEIVAHLKPVEGQSLTFQSDDLVKPRDVRFVPFYKLYNEHYTVYWKDTAVAPPTAVTSVR